MLILAAGAMGNAADPDALARRRCRRSRATSASTSASTATTSPASSTTRRRCATCSACPATAQFYKGKPITTMTYDFWVGRRGHELRRHALHAPGDLPLARSTQLPLRRRPRARRRAVVVGPAEEAARSRTWNNHIELLAMVEDTNDGDVPRAAAERRRRAARTRARSGSAPFNYQLSEQSVRVREAANAGDAAQVVERAGLGRFMKLTETRGVYCRAPARRLPDGGVRPTSAWSTTAARCSATRACSASTPRRSRRRSA